MAQLPRPANTEGNKEQMGDFSPKPEGKYLVAICKSAYKVNKAKNGHFLELHLKICDGKYKGNVFFERLNLDNPSKQAVDIANKTLNTISQACGKIGVQDSEELHGIPMMVTVELKPKTTTQPASNNMKFYESAHAIAEAAEQVERETESVNAIANHVNPENAGENAGPVGNPSPDRKKYPWEE